MHTVLEKLFEEYNLGDKDRYEINQIYSFLSPQKKIQMVENFWDIVKHVWRLKSEMFKEQEILFDNTLQNIEQKIKLAKQNQIQSSTQSEILALRNFILES